MRDSFANPWTVACKVPLSMGFSRQEYCSGLPFPPTGDLPHTEIKPASPYRLYCEWILHPLSHQETLVFLQVSPKQEHMTLKRFAQNLGASKCLRNATVVLASDLRIKCDDTCEKKQYRVSVIVEL